MNPSVNCYPQLGKAKSRDILRAFAAGCGGRVVEGAPPALEPGPAAFFGVVGLEHLLHLACAESRPWYYGDNAFFDVARGRFYRFAHRELQISRPPKGEDHARFRALGLPIEPWRSSGGHVVVIEQSEHFMRVAGAPTRWLDRVVADLRQHTDRPFRLRRWQSDKGKAAASLPADLKGAWALVTWSSAAAVTALLAGVPVFIASKQCAAAPMASGELAQIETPRLPEDREDWAAGLAARQWTLDELRAGLAWRALNG